MVPRITVSRPIHAPIEKVWPVLADLEGHTRWMKDAQSIRITGPTRRGVGTTMVVVTRVGPLRTDDALEVVGWEEGRSITVRHRGLITGTGELRVDAVGTGSRVTWSEELAFPWWLGGPIAALLARPVLRRIWRRNLDALAELASSS